METWRILAGLTLISAILVAGCAGIGRPGTGSGAQTVGSQASGAPTVSSSPPAVLIVDPPFDGGVSAGAVTVSVQVAGFILAPPGGPNRQGMGHLVYYRDISPKTVQGETALTGPDTYITSSDTSYTWEGVAQGTHTFAVQLVNADDTPLDPPAIDAVDVTAVSRDMIGTESGPPSSHVPAG